MVFRKFFGGLGGNGEGVGIVEAEWRTYGNALRGESIDHVFS